MEKRVLRRFAGPGLACLFTIAIASGVSVANTGLAASTNGSAGTPQEAQQQDSNTAEKNAAGKSFTYAELAQMYPDEYNSAKTHKSDENGTDNSHAGFQELMETPAVRDAGGAILEVVDPGDPRLTPVALKCVSCKSSRFTDAYYQEGADAFSTIILDDEWTAFMDGEYWDCYSCHTADEQGNLSLETGCAYGKDDIFPKVAAFYDTLDKGEALCGQCHNTVSARDRVQSVEDAESYDPYRYGYDLDARYKAMIEDGVYSVDEATGIKLVTMNHPQIEVFQDSVHQSLGLTCVSCHMPETTNAEGEKFTSHNASGKVADNDDAMATCLTCHGGQDGLETVDDMRSFLADKQAEQLKRQNEVQTGLDGLYDAILDAQDDPSVDADALQTAKDNYSLANWYVKEQQGNLIDAPDGAQIAHDPAELRSLLERANALVEDSMELLGA